MADWSQIEDEILSQFAGSGADHAQGASYDDGGSVDGTPDFIPDDQVPPDQANVSPVQAGASGITSTDAPDFISDQDAPDFIPDQQAGQPAKPAKEPPSTLASAVRMGARSGIESPGVLAAAEFGAGAGAVVGGPIGAFVGGVAGALGGGYLMDKALSYVGDTFGIDALSTQQEQTDVEAHPYASTVGGLVGNAATFGGGAATAATRLASGAIFGGMETGQEVASKGEIDPAQIALNVAGGLLMPGSRGWTHGFAGASREAGESVAGKFRPGRPDTQGLPGEAQEKKDVDQNDLTTVARGVAAENPPVNENISNIGNPGSAPVRSDRTYPKKEGAQGSYVQTVEMHPDVEAALMQSLETSDLESRATPPEQSKMDVAQPKEAQPPIDTGIEAAAPAEPVQNQDVKPEPAPPSPEAPAETKVETQPTAPEQSEPVKTESETQPAKEATDATEAAPDFIPDEKAPPAEPETTGSVQHPTVTGEEPAPGDRYPHPELPGVTVDRTAMLTKPSEMALDGKTAFVDSRLPRSIDVNGKALNPDLPLAVKEAVTHKVLDAGQGKVKLKDAQMIGAEAEKAWLHSRGYDYDAYHDALNAALKAKPASANGAEAKVTATVTKRPAVVEQAYKAAENMPKVKAALDAAKPEELPGMARKVLEAVTNRTGKISGKDYATARVPSKPAEVEGMGVTARSKGDAARKSGALNAIKEAFTKFSPADDKVPTSKDDKAALKERLQGAIDHARKANGGGDPLATYQPRVKPAEYMWLRDAKRLISGRMTQRQIAEFVANEKQLRSGATEDVENVRSSNRIDADIAMGRGPTVDEAELHGNTFDAVPAEDVEVGASKEIKGPDDIEPPKNVEADLSKMSTDDLDKLQADQQKVTQNLIAAHDKGDVEPGWKKAEAERAENTASNQRKQQAARLQAEFKRKPAEGMSEGAASTVRKIAITDDIAKAALKSADEAAAKAKSRAAPEAKPVAESDVPKAKDLKDFFDDQAGSLNIGKIENVYRAKKQALHDSFERYFGTATRDIPLKADAILAKSMATANKWRAEMSDLLDARWYRWAKVPLDDTMKYLDALENAQQFDKATFKAGLEARGLSEKSAEWMADEAKFHRDLLDNIFKQDEAFGSKAEYRKAYVAHIFKDEAGAQKFIDERIRTLGANWYQKGRFFDRIAEALKAGFELKFNNPIDIISARWAASINSNLITSTLRDLQRHGMAFQTKDAPDFAKQWEYKFHNAGDGTQWAIHPDSVNLWRNAMEAKGLVESKNELGSAYRTWMKIKNVWAPIELALSAFHAVHIASINVAQHMTTAIKLGMSQGNLGEELLKAGKLSLDQSLFSWPVDKIKMGGIGKALDDMSGNRFSQNQGRAAMEAWHVPPAEQTPQQRMDTLMLKEMSLIPSQAAQEMIGAKKALATALMNKDYVGVVPTGVRRVIEKIQEPLFKYFIPNLKASAGLNAARAAIKMDPELAINASKRAVVMREIGNNIHDRYGEMFYDSLFWNKYMKDIGIGSMLSLSWNLGQFRQAGGAISNAVKMGTGAKMGRMQRAAFNASDKGTFVLNYVGISMASAGLMSYALSGQIPTGLDYFFPRNGENNPDGTPARLTDPFNTREIPMLMGHAQEHNSWIGGALNFLWNKMMLSPITEAWNNRDFYGNNLYDTNAPWYKQALQLVDSTLGGHLNPIAISGAQRAKEMGGGVRDQALSYAGFGPAPKYVSHSAAENRVDYVYHQMGSPDKRPYEYGPKTGLGRGLVQGGIRALVGDKTQTEAREEGRGLMNRGLAQKNMDLVRQGQVEMVKEGGISARTAGSIRPSEEYQFKFSRLPPVMQKQLYDSFSPEDQKYFVLQNPKLSIQRKGLITKH